MCGIAGYSLSLGAASIGRSPRRRCSPGSPIAAPTPSATPIGAGRTSIRSSRSSGRPRAALLERITVPAHADELLIHVRDYTKGHPSIPANNHPVRHGPVVGIHNGIIVNDDELLAPYSCARSEPRMTVDSEAIFALAAHSRNDPRALEELARLDGDRLARRARAGNASSPPAASAGRSGSAAAATRSSSPPPAPRSRSSPSTRACGCG